MDCPAEGFDDNSDLMPASVRNNLEIPRGSVDHVEASSSAKRNIKSTPSIQSPNSNRRAGTQLGVGVNNIEEKRKISSLYGNIPRLKRSSPLPFSLTIPSSMEGLEKEDQVQHQQQKRTIMNLRDLMFNTNVLGPIPNFDKERSNVQEKKDKNERKLIIEENDFKKNETHLLYNAKETAKDDVVC